MTLDILLTISVTSREEYSDSFAVQVGHGDVVLPRVCEVQLVGGAADGERVGPVQPCGDEYGAPRAVHAGAPDVRRGAPVRPVQAPATPRSAFHYSIFSVLYFTRHDCNTIIRSLIDT